MSTYRRVIVHYHEGKEFTPCGQHVGLVPTTRVKSAVNCKRCLSILKKREKSNE